jgi:hypothetical protein
MKNKVGIPFLPENFELKPIKSIRDGDKLTTTFRLVPTITGANPKKFKVTLTPNVPEGKLNPGAVIGNAVITKGTDNKDLYTVTFPIALKNIIDPGKNYAINVNDGSTNLKQTNVPEALPVCIVRPVHPLETDFTNDYFYVSVDLQYNYGNSAIGDYKVVWSNSPSPNGQFRVTKHGGPSISYPINIKVKIAKPDPMSNSHFHDIEEQHYYSHMGTNITESKDPPIKVKDPR